MAYSYAERLMRVGTPAEQAKLFEEMVAEGGLQIGTTSTTAMAGDRTPTVSIRGGVLQATAQANSTAVDVAGLVVDFNALLAKLRTAGVIAT